MGDHVKVMHGKYEGETGFIVRVEENNIIFVSDLTLNEARCRISFLFLVGFL